MRGFGVIMNAVNEVMYRVDYARLRHQRSALLELAYLGPQWEETADGLTNFFDALIDAAIEDGIPGAEGALLTEE